MSKPPLELQTFHKLIQRKMDKGEPVLFQTSEGDHYPISNPNLFLFDKEKPEEAASWTLNLTLVNRDDTRIPGNSVGTTFILSKVGDFNVLHRSWRKATAPIDEEIDKGVRVLAKILSKLVAKAAGGGQAVYLLTPEFDQPQAYVLSQITEVKIYDGESELSQKTGFIPSLGLKYKRKYVMAERLIGLDEIDSDWQLSEKTLSIGDVWVLHRNSQEAENFVNQHLTDKTPRFSV